jgi:glutamate formiminotransferase/formiminotetrahydrofolate cyclodeaminase
MGDFLNVRINAKDLEDQGFSQEILKKAGEIEQMAIAKEKEILEVVNKKLG